MIKKLKPFFTIGLSVVLILSVFATTTSALNYSDEARIKASEATDLDAQYIRFKEADSTTSDKLDLQVAFTPYLSEAIRIAVPENLVYQESTERLQGTNQIYLDELKNEIVIQPAVKTQATETSDTATATSDSALNDLSQELPAPAALEEQVVELQFTAKEAGAYKLQAATSYNGSEVTSDELQVEMTVADNEIEAEQEQKQNEDSKPVAEQPAETTAASEKTVQTAEIQPFDITITGNVADVTDWAGFRTAIRNPAINVINIMNDIENDAGTSSTYNDTQVTGYSITRDIEINGNGNRMNFKGTALRVGVPAAGTTPTFHLHDFSYINQDGAQEELVGSGLVNTTSARWKWRFGNIITSKSNTSTTVGIRRIGRLATAEVTLYGNNELITQGENFYAGSMIVEPGTRWKGKVTSFNFSIVWYSTASPAGSTGATKEFTVGANANIQLGSDNLNSTAYPAIFDNFKDMTIGENAVFNVGMPGTAVRFNNSGSMTVKKGAIVNLTSTTKGAAGTNYSAVAFAANNSTFTAEPGSFVYIIGNSTRPLVNLSASFYGETNGAYTGNKFELNSPAQYDIRNIRDGNYPAIQIYYANSPTNNEFKVVDSDIDLWNLNTTVMGPSSLTYAMVESLSVLGGGTTQKATSTVSELAANFKSASFRQISGMNQAPVVEFDSDITDAHLTIKAKVKIGEVPNNNGANEDGNVTYEPVYASANQAKVTLTDTFGVAHTDLTTDANGYVQYRDTVFNLAGQDITGSATRGPWVSEKDTSTTVIDVTPPKIADIPDSIRMTSKKIQGVNGEPGATISYTVNGQDATKGGTVITAVVNPDGTWELAIPDTKFVLGDTLQFFLTDTAGNKNPVTQKSLYDATFPAGTIVIVQDGVLTFVSAPTEISFGDNILIGAKTTNYPITSMDGSLTVEDTRQVKSSWTLSAKMSQVLTSPSNKTLPQAVRYTTNGNQQTLGTAKIIVYQNTNLDDDPLSISDNWIPNGEGLSLTIKPGEAYPEAYQGEIEWTLEDTP